MTSALSTIAPDQNAEIRAVCLDVDDTLVDYEASARSAFAEVVGYDDEWPTWQRITDEHLALVLAGEIDRDTMRNARTRAFFAVMGEDMDADEAAALELRRQHALRRRCRLFADARPCLDWLRAHDVRLAAVTNASGSHQRAKLVTLGVADLFDSIVIAGEVRAAKPDPVIFHTACVALGVAPAQAIHVGDRLDVDVLGARDAGMRGVWLNRHPRPGVEAPPDVSVINTLDELPELLLSALVPQRR